MRLGQLARKLEVRPADIVEYLATQDVQIDNGTNTRLDPDHENLAIQHFAPGLIIGQPVDEISENVHEEVDDPDTPSSSGESTIENSSELSTYKAEVIKAPKIELTGLKVLGKIELPEPKKKETDSSTVEKSELEPQKDLGKQRKFNDNRRQQRPAKNPIALRREQEAEEARKKSEEEHRLLKERRTQNYLKKVKTPQQTKAVRIFKEETQEMSASELKEPPKTLWGKFVKWLTT